MKKVKKFVNKVLENVWILLLGYAAIALIAILLFHTVLSISYIPSGSMENTLMPGDVVVSSCFHLDEEHIERYDILIFEPSFQKDALYIKRVIGLPGETIEVKDGKVFADGAELDASFVNGTQNCNADGVWKVPDGCLFFLGDNRNNSADSRYWEGDAAFVPIGNVKGQAQMVLLPFSRLQRIG